eukprot:CAMPEP_0183364996 /NCGR_PEP_ID=MMETSP0164_2-20130417/82911_1 /TAXON_ID=221442 /ORGANISM="Coccolithus pelagicus ssp braarudi, Strain PLY182g" /LENGTH=129 /DNA_ID=CAMNT_0025540421 /DNA_START=575 /DNA_END=964 /DNA_ORIENTATION=+
MAMQAQAAQPQAQVDPKNALNTGATRHLATIHAWWNACLCVMHLLDSCPRRVACSRKRGLGVASSELVAVLTLAIEALCSTRPCGRSPHEPPRCFRAGNIFELKVLVQASRPSVPARAHELYRHIPSMP